MWWLQLETILWLVLQLWQITQEILLRIFQRFLLQWVKFFKLVTTNIFFQFSGGSGDWRSVTTIPNILKQFNPNVIGFSAGFIFLFYIFLPILCFSGDFNEKGLNFGRSDATSKDLEEQAMDLVSAIESDERIDMNTYWKVAIFH